ncbi:MAG: tRNA 2-thiouridine(34) synthase MnmA [Parvibaculaceae bacterium]
MSLDRRTLDAVRAGLDLPEPAHATRVVIAMSGGVDSSVAAGLLKHLGYDVVGITLQLYDHGAATARKGACCAGADIHDARAVARALSIPHYVLDFERRFREAVIEDFAASYVEGRTPIPCVRCNQTVKFTDLLSHARDLGAAALVTGHYARRVRRGETVELATPKDMTRDQSYFLFATTPAQLSFLRFPLGELTKAETRAAAAALGLPVSEKPDSQDICFVPTGRYGEVVEGLRPDAAAAGEIVHVDGGVLGTHAGISGFTVGQRRGLGIAGREPLYVQAIDAGRRRVTVGPRAGLLKRHIRIEDVNWLGDFPFPQASRRIPVHVKIRSTRPPVPASLVAIEDGAWVHLDEAEPAIAPGQACVFYERPGEGARVLGGGLIVAAEAESAATDLAC